MNYRIRFLKNKLGQVPWMWVIIAAIISILLIGLGFTLAQKTSNLGDRALEVFVGS